jgi:snurportin-1
MDARQERRRGAFKARDFGAQSHAKRLAAVFERQRRDRTATHAALRAAARAATAPHAEAPEAASDAPERARQQPARRPPPVAIPEWLVSVPPDLRDAWYAVPRPDGKRVFVVASAGRTVVRSRDGRRLAFGGGGGGGRRRRGARGRGGEGLAVSGLPGGKPGSRGLTVLDCVMPGAGAATCLWVLDVMVWNDRYMHDCPAEFRFFWLQNSLAELDDNDVGDDGDGPSCADVELPDVDGGDERESGGEGDEQGGRSWAGRDSVGERPHWFNFRPVPVYDADDAGISAAADPAQSAASRMKSQDGILLYAKDAHVELGLTPVVLAWKDASTSAHAIETFPEPAPAGVEPRDWPLVATLSHAHTAAGTHALATSDSSPVIVAEVPEESLASLGRAWASRLVRVRVLNAEAVADGQAPQVELVELAGYGRAVADSWSRILFQCLARHRPVTVDVLRGGAAGPAAAR